MQVIRKAYAKINLGLDVLYRRNDGYHEVKMIMQTVGIHDVLTFHALSGGEDEEKIRIRIAASGKNPDGIFLPCDENNLIYKAAKRIYDRFPALAPVEITLQKNIPIAAGMAGGSTDAAAVFHGLNELFDLRMSPEELQALGVKVGADVPYCLMGGTALAEGIGEKLTALPAPPEAFLVIAKPPVNVSTGFVYGNLHADTLSRHPDIDGMCRALEEGNLQGIADRMENVLETVTLREYPVIQTIKDTLREDGALNALMSGSGPTVFGIFKDRETAERAKERQEKLGAAGEIFVTIFQNGESGNQGNAAEDQGEE